MDPRILIVEDDDQLRSVLLTAVGGTYTAEAVRTAEEAIDRAARSQIDIGLLDVSLPQMSGIDLIPHLLRLCPGIVIVVMSGDGHIASAVEAMKRGAIDFLSKPFQIDDLKNVLKLAATRVPHAASGPAGQTKADFVVGQSPVMKEVLSQAAAISAFNSTVLITGETGTGKELLARSIHRQSPRSKRPFVALNCAAVPEHLLEDELFGHIKGAYTGAINHRDGRFEQADGGTLFLDEIGDMSMPLQAKLLRVLQEREFEKLGSSRTIKVDVRIVAATSADLERRMNDSTFRADLYYRLNVVRLRLPALCEREGDVQALAEYLLSSFCTNAGIPMKHIDSQALDALCSYRWPGNIRQLQNAMERAAVMASMSTVITISDLPEEVRAGAPLGISTLLCNEHRSPEDQSIPPKGVSFDSVVSEMERNLLLNSLKQTRGNKMQAAKLLNMKRTTFVEKLKRLGIPELESADCPISE